MRAALIAATATGLATGLGALPFLFVRELPRRVYDGVLGLGAGLMLAAATLGLLGEALAGVRGPGGVGLVAGRLLRQGPAAAPTRWPACCRARAPK